MKNQIKDPGIGTKLDGNVRRIINADGSYNVHRKGATNGIKDIFKYLVEVKMSVFILILFLTYLSLNILFTVAYFFCGLENISGIDPNEGPLLFQAFFFSIQTFTTVGYGTLAPLGVLTQSVAALEAFVGLLSFSLATGLLWGRFSRPQSKLIFADKFVYSKYESGYSFKFKLTNKRDIVLQEVEAKVIVMFNELNDSGTSSRQFYQLPLTLPRLEILALTWTLVHHINEDSPFWNKSKEDISAIQPEFLVMVKGFDEIYSERTRARKSYIVEDIVWNKNFETIFKSHENGKVELDVRHLNNLIDE